MTTEKKSYALPIAMMFALFFMIAFVTGLPSPMGVIVAKQFGATTFQSQLGFFANFIAYAFMGIPAGIMLKRIGYKKTALSAITVGFIGVGVQFLSGQAQNFTVYLIGAFISGFSMCMLNTVVNPMLNTLGGGGNKGNQLIQFGGSINSVAATITPMLVGYLMGAEAGRTIEKANPALFLAMGIFALAFIVLAFVKIPEPHITPKALVKEKDPYGPMSFRHFILGIIAIFVYVGVEIGIPSTANLLMTQPVDGGGLAMDAAIAGSVVGTYWLLMLVGRLLGAVVGAKVSSKLMMGVVSSVALILLAIAIFCPLNVSVSMPAIQSEGGLSFALVKVPLSVMFFVLCGLCTSVMWGSIFNLAVEGLGKYTAAASGLFMVMVCGGGILPLIQGFVADRTNYISSYWVIVVAVAYMLFYALIGSKNVNKNIVTK
ncbi:MAG: MFS transporter [Bacteroidales bacterium]|jgi:FHS family L-fucose permease-like MFS transporter|nr:MFS transporter [Bacteroidales bacterium]MDD4257373.1 MFS transporter [Bacteroidales bacterium]MDD4654388.1 MFS transporter [Bacteroidales bacterium]